MARILRAPLARTDLLDIWSYIAEQSSDAIADGFLARIYGALEVVSQAPYIGRERSEFPGSPAASSCVPTSSFMTSYQRAMASCSGGCFMARAA
jgi:plasmid stabilization system protein ParE